ncbi:MAG: hypothetical protein LQ342_006532 [Letrouitia transgressa]|nr:MAG: hypothetical protein LQ342_006532 [Letrouitia transgressa]
MASTASLSESASSFDNISPATSQTSSEQTTLDLQHGSVCWRLPISGQYKSIIHSHFKTFKSHLSQSNSYNPNSIIIGTQYALATEFLKYLRQIDGEDGSSTKAVFQAFENLPSSIDVHPPALIPNKTSRELLLDNENSSRQAADASQSDSPPMLSYAKRNEKVSLYGLCEGQGTANTVCLKELRELHRTHGDFLKVLLEIASETLGSLAILPEVSAFYDNIGFNVRQWVEDPKAAPEDEVLPLAPLSFPLIGLLSLSHFCVTCKLLQKSPGDVRDAFKGITGHSQGIVAAMAIARSSDWPSFYKSVQVAMVILFWIGFECHNHMPFRSLALDMVNDSIEAGEAAPSPMLSVRGLDRKQVQSLLDDMNRHLRNDEMLYISLINTHNNMVIAGSPHALHSLSVRLRNMRATDELDQSKIVFNLRKPFIRHQFLPMSSAFHCPHSDMVTPLILRNLRSLSLCGEELMIGVYHTRTGEDLRTHGKHDVVSCLVKMITADLVDWPLITQVSKASIFVDFGPGRLRSLIQKSTEGTGVQVINASEMSLLWPIGSQMNSLSSSSWEELFKPRLTTDSRDVTIMETKMTRLLGVPPVMVAGMTPTTVPWDFVASIMKAGYHAELAVGGYHSASSLEKAIVQLSQQIPSSRGITCNIIYANPKAVRWQIPLIQELVRKGYPIEGLTIGAGVPSAEIVKEYIETMGLKHISFKPGSSDAILNVIEIAKKYPDFPVGLQWTGGRAGGHHSFEDFHTPILETYAQIRQCNNIILIAGSGFGGAEDTYPYLVGSWSKDMGHPPMPFDGVLLGSRMMVAKEAHTSDQAKELIVQAAGVSDSEWHTSYTKPTGGIITVKSEWGQPIHKLATNGVLLWHDLDQKFFSIADRSKRLNELRKHRSWIIEKLNKDFQKPWFGVDCSGRPVELEDMTYFELLKRLINLMYVQNQNRWVDPSYQSFMLDIAVRSRERLDCNTRFADNLDQPDQFLFDFLKAYPGAETELLHPEDISYFISLCGQPGRKPINFIPRLDENFESWFKKDSLWQAEDIEAVPDLDAQRVCIIQGPVSVRYSTIVNEPTKTILGKISTSHVEKLRQNLRNQKNNPPPDDFNVIGKRHEATASHLEEEKPAKKCYRFPTVGELPDTELFRKNLLEDLSGWALACVSDKFIRQGHLNRPNPIRSAFVPTHGHMITVEYKADRQVAALIMSIGDSHVEQNQVLYVTKNDEDNVVALLHDSVSRAEATLEFRFKYSCDIANGKLSEDINGRNQKIKDFYGEIWLGRKPDDLQATKIQERFSGSSVTLTSQMVQDFSRALSPHHVTWGLQRSSDQFVPLDISIVIVWEALVKPLLSPAIDCDLLQLLHRSNEFQYINGAKPLRVGDALEASSQVQSVTIQDGNKLVEIVGEIMRDGVVIIEVRSKFFCKGSFTDFADTMSSVKEPDFEVLVKSEKEIALLTSRKWLNIFQDPQALIGETLIFAVTSQTTYNRHGESEDLHVFGEIKSKRQDDTISIGSVNFEGRNCVSNPVVDFLNRHGIQPHKAQPLPNPGLRGNSTWTIKCLKTNKVYGQVSKDKNPIHVSPVFAHYAHLPGIVNHGMSTSAIIYQMAERTIAEADPSRIRRYSASFEGVVLPGDELKVQVQHFAMIDGRMLFKIQAFNHQNGEKVVDVETEVEQAPTAYFFTGQGSQEKNMGMALYESSNVARALWDNVDRYLHDIYGFSIIDIVRNDRKSLTVYFGGAKGREIRNNYLAMVIERVHPNGQVIQEPIVKGLTSASQSYTFSDPRGLLYSTQFAQPALVLMEMAAFVDLKSKGLIQEGAPYAGHSLGEYSALGALARVMPMESLVSLVFYRGLTMQVAMERDQEGRTAFSMVAVNPSRVNKTFNQGSLETVVKMVGRETATLLEIVNFNVDGRQYVCAGHLRALWTLTQVLNTLSQRHVLDKEALLKLVQKEVETAFELAEPIELEQGLATTPLRGIDVPFHSTYLRNGIPAYKRYLEKNILEENINVDTLHSFIPNVMAKPFSTDRDYVEEVARTTESESLREMLENVCYWPCHNRDETEADSSSGVKTKRK